MKNTKIFTALLLIALTLTGCSGNGASAPVTTADSGAQSVSGGAASSAASSSKAPRFSVSVISGYYESKQPVESEPEPDLLAEKTELTLADFQDVACCLRLWGEFFYGLHPAADNTYCPPVVDLDQSVTEEITRDGSSETYTETYYKLIDTQFAWEKDLFGRQESYGYTRGMLDVIFTKDFQEQLWNSPDAKRIKIKDGGVYVAPVSRDGFDELKKVKIDMKLNDDKSILATVTYEPENGETETYHATFVSSKRYIDYTLDSVDANDGSMVGLPRLFGGNVEVVSEQLDLGIKTGSDADYKRLPTREELNDIVRLFRDFKYWQTDILHFWSARFEPQEDPMYFFVDPEQSITVSDKEAEEQRINFNDTYNKAIKAPLRSEQELDELLDTMMTDNFKEIFYEFNTSTNVLLIRDGSVYLHEGGGEIPIRGAGMSRLELNSMGFTDDNTVLMKFTDVGDKDEWGLEKDLRDEVTVKLVKGSDGKFRFDGGDNYERFVISVGHYNGMFYENGMLFG